MPDVNDLPSAHRVQSIVVDLSTMTREQQRRTLAACLVLCGLYREAQSVIDLAVASLAEPKEPTNG